MTVRARQQDAHRRRACRSTAGSRVSSKWRGSLLAPAAAGPAVRRRVRAQARRRAWTARCIAWLPGDALLEFASGSGPGQRVVRALKDRHCNQASLIVVGVGGAGRSSILEQRAAPHACRFGGCRSAARTAGGLGAGSAPRNARVPRVAGADCLFRLRRRDGLLPHTLGIGSGLHLDARQQLRRDRGEGERALEAGTRAGAGRAAPRESRPRVFRRAVTQCPPANGDSPGSGNTPRSLTPKAIA